MSADNKELEVEFNKAIKEMHSAIDKAIELADKGGFSFTLADGQTYVGTNNGKRLTVEDYWDGIYYDDMEEDDERFDPEYDYAGWQNSSTFC